MWTSLQLISACSFRPFRPFRPLNQYILLRGYCLSRTEKRASGTHWLGDWWAPELVWTIWRSENSLSSVVQPIASRYINCTTADESKHNLMICICLINFVKVNLSACFDASLGYIITFSYKNTITYHNTDNITKIQTYLLCNNS
jgi:hypothetical protein